MKKSAANQPESGDQFGQGFGRKLKNYEATPSADLWSRIELTLDKEEAVIYKKRWKLYSQLAAACLALLMVAGGAFYWQHAEALTAVPGASEETIAQNNSGQVSENNAGISRANTAQPQSTISSETSVNAANKTAGTKPVTSEPQTENTAIANSGLNENTITSAQNSTINAEKPGKEILLAAVTSKTENNQNPVNKSEARITVKPTAKTSGIIGAIALTKNTGNHTAAKTTSGIERSNTSSNNHSFTKTATTAAVANQSETVMASAKTVAKTPENATNNFASNEPTSANVANTNQVVSANTVKNSAGNPVVTKTENQPAIAENVSSRAEITLLETRLTHPETVPDTMKKSLPVLAFMPDSGLFKPVMLPAALLSKWSIGAAYTVQQFNQNVAIAFPSQESAEGKAPFTTLDVTNLNAAEKEYNANTKTAYSWQGNLHIGYQIFPKWQLQSGLNYTINQAQTSASYIVKTGSETGSTSLIPSTSSPLIVSTLATSQSKQDPEMAAIETTERFKTVYRYEYIGIPISIEFQPRISAKFKGFLGCGVTINHLLEARISSNRAGLEDATYQGGSAVSPYREWQVAVNGGAGFSYNVTPQISLLAGAEANYYVEPLLDAGKLPVRAEQPYTLGFKMGVSFQFNKAATK